MAAVATTDGHDSVPPPPPSKRSRGDSNGRETIVSTGGGLSGGSGARGGAGGADADYLTFNGPVDDGIDKRLSSGRTIEHGRYRRDMPLRIPKRLRAMVEEIMEDEEEEHVTLVRQMVTVCHMLRHEEAPDTFKFKGHMRDHIWIDPTHIDDLRPRKRALDGAIITGFYNARYEDTTNAAHPDNTAVNEMKAGNLTVMPYHKEKQAVHLTKTELATAQWQSGSGFHFPTADLFPRDQTNSTADGLFSARDLDPKPDQAWIDVNPNKPVDVEYIHFEYGFTQTGDYDDPSTSTRVTNSTLTSPKDAPQFSEIIFGTIPSVAKLRDCCQLYGLQPEELLLWQLGEQNDRPDEHDVPFGRRWAVPKYNATPQLVTSTTTNRDKSEIRRDGRFFNRAKIPKMFNITKVDKYKHQPRTKDTTGDPSGNKVVSNNAVDKMYGCGTYTFKRLAEMHWQEELLNDGQKLARPDNADMSGVTDPAPFDENQRSIRKRLVTAMEAYTPDADLQDAEVQALMRTGRLHGACHDNRYYMPLTGYDETVKYMSLPAFNDYAVSNRDGSVVRSVYGASFCFPALKFENDVPFIYVRGNAPSNASAPVAIDSPTKPQIHLRDTTTNRDPVINGACLNTTPYFVSHADVTQAEDSSAKRPPTGGLRFHCRYKMGFKRSLQS